MSEKWGVARGYRNIELSEDELMHWKYIKRYKGSNGKWRYVYADKETHKTINDNFKDASKEKHAAELDRKIRRNVDVVRPGGAQFWKELNESSKRHEQKAIRYENDAYWTISKNSISSVSKNTIQKAKSWLSNLFKKK